MTERLVGEEQLPPDSHFVHHSIRPGDRRNIGFSMFEEYELTYSPDDERLLRNLWQDVLNRTETYPVNIDLLIHR